MPRHVPEQVRKVITVVARGEAGRALPLFVPGLLARNLLFVAVVLLHGFRRLLPPY